MGFYRDPKSPIPIPEIQDRDLPILFQAPILGWIEKSEIPGIGIGMFKPQKIPRAKSRKSRESESGNVFRKNPEIFMPGIFEKSSGSGFFVG